MPQYRIDTWLISAFDSSPIIGKNAKDIRSRIQRQDPKSNTLTLEVTFQGCADAGVCYMPIQATISFDLSDKRFNGWSSNSFETCRYGMLFMSDLS